MADNSGVANTNEDVKVDIEATAVEAQAAPAAPVELPALAATSEASSSAATGTQVFSPPADAFCPAPLDDAFFEPSIADVQSLQSTIVGRSKQLNDAPLLTSKHRDADKAAAERKKAEKWPTATIRIKFSNGTQIQSTFPSSSPIQPVYAFVRESLHPTVREKNFMLYQPPGVNFPERPPPEDPKKKKPINPAMKGRVVTASGYGPARGASMAGGTGGKESLSALGLVPQSVLLVRWDDAEMNASNYPAPLTEELAAKAAPLPAPVVKEAPAATSGTAPEKRKNPSDVKMPKWLQKGLMKKK